MKKYTTIIAAVAATALSFSAHATLSGTFGFSGSASLTGGETWGGPLTTVNLTSASMANNNTGSYAGLDGVPTIFNNPVNISTASPAEEVFTATVGLDTYVFYSSDIFSSAYNPNLSSQYAVAGDGTMTEWIGGTEVDSSASGIWTLDISSTSQSFTFAGTGGETNTVPDGGLTMALLGGSLITLQAIRRKLGC